MMAGMTVSTRLDRWKDQGALSPEQYALLDGLVRGKPFSVFLELNILLYAGVLAFVGGLGWTIETYSLQLGDVAILTVLSVMLVACLTYCFSKASPWSRAETPSPNLVLDYVLYLGTLIWSVELAYIEEQFHLLSGQWDLYLLITALVYFGLAYRFDNRFVLSMALSALAGWFGLTIVHRAGNDAATWREYAIIYSLVIGAVGLALNWQAVKRHFLGTYLNVAANVFFVAVLAGVFEQQGYVPWLLLLIVACGASFAYGRAARQFSFVAYAAVYAYVGVSSVLLRNVNNVNATLSYFVITGIAMVVMLVVFSRRFGREA
jgi:hypothetical protein